MRDCGLDELWLRKGRGLRGCGALLEHLELLREWVHCRLRGREERRGRGGRRGGADECG